MLVAITKETKEKLDNEIRNLLIKYKNTKKQASYSINDIQKYNDRIIAAEATILDSVREIDVEKAKLENFIIEKNLFLEDIGKKLIIIEWGIKN